MEYCIIGEKNDDRFEKIYCILRGNLVKNSKKNNFRRKHYKKNNKCNL